MMVPCSRKHYAVLAGLCWLLATTSGCGTTKSYTATDQLLMSDAVDATVAKLSFQAISGKRVFLDTTYIKTVKSSLLIDSDYVLSSLRQQMVSHGVLLVEQRDEAELIAEARLGALGLDGHNVVYGLPASNALASASSIIGNAPPIPSIPEISFARKEAKSGAAKLAVFVYDRESREPYWQSGIAQSTSNSRDTWVFGVGPFQRGTIYDGTRFAGGEVMGEIVNAEEDEVRKSLDFAEYHTEHYYPNSRIKSKKALGADEDGVRGLPAIPASDAKPTEGNSAQPENPGES